MKIVFFIIPLCVSLSAFGQNRTYVTYKNISGLFSFDCPSTWISQIDSTSLPDTESDEYNNAELPTERFISSDKEEFSIYKNCYGGIIFDLEVNNKSLDSTLLEYFYIKEGNKYFATFGFMLNKLTPTQDIEGHNWCGIHHFSTCRISCNEEGFGSAIVDECEFLYFSNGEHTVNISTSGKAIDDDVLKVILSTFKFNE